MDDSVIWPEHGNRTYIRDRRRFMRPAFILGLILVAGCAVVWWLGVELSDWLGFVYFMAALMGLGLIVSPGLELLALRKMEKKARRGRDDWEITGTIDLRTLDTSKPWPESQEPPCRFTEPG
jgi:hypothetical protein